MTASQALKNWRNRNGLSQQAAADRIPVHRVTWAKWEANMQTIGVDNMGRIESATGIPKWELRPDIFGSVGQDDAK